MHSMLCMSKQLIHFVHNKHTCNGMHMHMHMQLEILQIRQIIKFTSKYWNFKLAMFELMVHFEHEMIRIWQNIYRNFEQSGTSN